MHHEIFLPQNVGALKHQNHDGPAKSQRKERLQSCSSFSKSGKTVLAKRKNSGLVHTNTGPIDVLIMSGLDRARRMLASS